jgi:hypothetical protein
MMLIENPPLVYVNKERLKDPVVVRTNVEECLKSRNPCTFRPAVVSHDFHKVIG